MNRFHAGLTDEDSKRTDEAYWTGWVRDRMKIVREACDLVDIFIAPSEHLQRRFVEEFHLPAEKVR